MSLQGARAVRASERDADLHGVRITDRGSDGASYASRVIATVWISGLFAAGMWLGARMAMCH